MPKSEAVFFDFDGVLCTDRFYTTLIREYPLAARFINGNIFGGPLGYADRWMRGEYTYHEINMLISEATGVPLDKLTDLFKIGVQQMKVNPELLQFAVSLKKKGIRIALVTNNMDIFNEITIPEKRLAEVFPLILNSFDYKLMKQDDNGKLFDIALEKLGLGSYRGVWLIDDSPTYCVLFTAKGGQAYQYAGQKEFDLWLDQGYLSLSLDYLPNMLKYTY
jgi:FMN phosphatase YigB (HAD superfamily)